MLWARNHCSLGVAVTGSFLLEASSFWAHAVGAVVPGSVGIQKQIAATEPREPLGGLEEKTKLLRPPRRRRRRDLKAQSCQVL